MREKKIDWELNGLADLKEFVEKCSEVAEEALGYTTRKQQARRKNEGRGRGRGKAAVAEIDEKEREYRNIDSIQKLLGTANNLCFDSPEITALRERFDSIAEFQEKARAALRDRPAQQSIARLDELLEEGKSFNVDLPELDSLEKVVAQLKWLTTVDDCKLKAPTLKEVGVLIEQGIELGIPENHPEVHHLQEKKIQGELWEAKAKELMSVENVHYQQLDALSKQATAIPVVPETLAAVDAILKKQRDAQELILSLYERSKNPDFRQRPKYMEVRNAVEALSALNSKPTGTIDLEREQKRHEDWMRRGKKLFGKANAPLHILHAHMKQVDERNTSCFDLSDQPRMPVEPSSRANTPDEDDENVDGSGSSRDVFCICRKPEAGIMIECDLCHEWYHSKCLKIARGKLKEEDKYTCPICDYRVKIPRDATRPKLEDLQLWQDEILTLPFQPEEEDTLESIIDHGTKFREYVAQYINPVMSSPEELTTQRFYLRKLEGAEILLADEINFFRQELHKWAPVAPTPPPILSVSLSTRKPRPTKQQKAMAQLGITNPDDLPPHLRPKTQLFKQRKSLDPTQPSLQPAPEQSHTPPGEPPTTRRSFGENDYFNSNTTTTGYNHSPTFATAAPLNFGSSIAPIDPGLFESSGAGPVSPMQDVFKSSGGGGGQEIFGEMMETGGGQAEEALAVTESNSYMD